MARLARVVAPGYPHHVTQRGCRRMRTFYRRSDYACYLNMLAERRLEVEVDVWAYCLMPNHVHLAVVPQSTDGLAALFQSVHRRHAWRVNRREGWKGHLWQERFYSVPMDEAHLIAAVRYIELNPVRAGLCDSPGEWPWSSVHAHRTGADDAVVSVLPMLQRVSDWDAYLAEGNSEEDIKAIREHTGTGRPLGGKAFVDRLEALTGRRLHKLAPGPRAKDK